MRKCLVSFLTSPKSIYRGIQTRSQDLYALGGNLGAIWRPWRLLGPSGGSRGECGAGYALEWHFRVCLGRPGILRTSPGEGNDLVPGPTIQQSKETNSCIPTSSIPGKATIAVARNPGIVSHCLQRQSQKPLPPELKHSGDGSQPVGPEGAGGFLKTFCAAKARCRRRAVAEF